jgi:putative hemolysin
MVEGVMELDQQRVGQIMTPRARIIWLNVADPDEVNWRKIVSSDHTYFPVYEGVTDNVLGMVSVKALWANLAVGVPANLRNLVVQPLFVPESMNAVRLLETFRETGKHIAMVSDEFGIPQGLVTVNDLLEAIVGDLPSEADRTRKCFRKREDGSIVVDAMMDIDDFKSELGIKSLPQETSEEYRSVGGFVMSQLGRIPREGDTFESAGYRFEVIDMDRHRVDKVLVVSVKA